MTSTFSTDEGVKRNQLPSYRATANIYRFSCRILFLSRAWFASDGEILLPVQVDAPVISFVHSVCSQKQLKLVLRLYYSSLHFVRCTTWSTGISIVFVLIFRIENSLSAISDLHEVLHYLAIKNLGGNFLLHQGNWCTRILNTGQKPSVVTFILLMS